MVFHVACNFLDRFLCTTIIEKSQLQLLGTVCLLISSKLRESTPLTVTTLSLYTDNTYSPDEIRVSKCF